MAKAGNRLQNGETGDRKEPALTVWSKCPERHIFRATEAEDRQNTRPLPFRTKKYRVQQAARFQRFPAMPYKNGTLEGAVFIPALRRALILP